MKKRVIQLALLAICTCNTIAMPRKRKLEQDEAEMHTNESDLDLQKLNVHQLTFYLRQFGKQPESKKKQELVQQLAMCMNESHGTNNRTDGISGNAPHQNAFNILQDCIKCVSDLVPQSSKNPMADALRLLLTCMMLC